MKNKIQLKVCGMRNPLNIEEVAVLAPDFMGFIFYRPSKRFVGDDFRVPASLPEQIKRVGVFVNEEMDLVLQKVAQHGLDFVQLHGEELPVVCKKLKNHVGVIKVFLVDENFQFDTLKPYVPFVDYFLFDTKSASYGGSGKKFDWKLLSRYTEPVPFFLSGGVNTDNILQALALSHPQFVAVDVNSGVESDYAVKDISKIINLKSKIVNHEIHG
jgi:phosphoribosylanthranilate isomerase